MDTGKPQKALGLESQHSRVQIDRHSAARQSKRNVVRLGWARHLPDEEGRHPLTQSVAHLRRAQNIVAVHQQGRH